MKRKPTKSEMLRMTLRQCWDQFYYKAEMSKSGLSQFGFNLAHFEKLTKNPPIGKITEEALEKFRVKALKQWSPSTVNSTRSCIRAILRRMGPQFQGNPQGMGVLDRVPYMRPSQVVRSIPHRVSQEDLSKFYISCNSMQLPRWGAGPPGWWWQTWIVVALFTGLRKSDMFGLRWENIDLDAGTMLFTAQKTRKASEFPLHIRAVEHLRRIINPTREYVFDGRLSVSGDFNSRWNAICEKAGIKRPFTPHDIRRTAGSEVERVKPGMGPVLLQHRFIDVSHTSYLNQIEELGEAINAMRVPVAFGQGCRQAERQLDRTKRENERIMKTARLAPPSPPHPSEWNFMEPAHLIGIRGKYIKAFGAAFHVMQAMANSPNGTCDLETLLNAVWPNGNRPASAEVAQGRVCNAISKLRVRLRHALCLPTEWNAIPCLERGYGGRWGIFLPSLAPEQRDGVA